MPQRARSIGAVLSSSWKRLPLRERGECGEVLLACDAVPGQAGEAEEVEPHEDGSDDQTEVEQLLRLDVARSGAARMDETQEGRRGAPRKGAEDQ